MIHTNRIVTVGEQECIIDRPIVLYRGDREVEIEFTLVGNEFMFSEEGNVIKSVNASHGQLVLNTPSGEHMFSELAECHEGKVVFVVTKEMIDEFIEMGFYSFQIRLYDSAEMKSRVTIPPVMNGFDIRSPIAAEDETNVVDQGIVDYARIFKDQSNEELPTFDWQGNYNKTEWAHHDVITENKMNKIEDALYSINANVKESDVVMLNALDNIKKDADKYVKEHMAEVEQDVEDFERNLNTDVEKFKVDTNAAMTAHKNEVSEVVEGFSEQLERIKKYDFEDFGGNGDGITNNKNAFLKVSEEIPNNSILKIKKGDYLLFNDGDFMNPLNPNDFGDGNYTSYFYLINKKNIKIQGEPGTKIIIKQDITTYSLWFLSLFGCENITIDNITVDYTATGSPNVNTHPLSDVVNGKYVQTRAGLIKCQLDNDNNPCKEVSIINCDFRLYHSEGSYPGVSYGAEYEGSGKLIGFLFYGGFNTVESQNVYCEGFTFKNNIVRDTHARVIWLWVSKKHIISNNKFIRCGGVRPIIRVLHSNYDTIISDNIIEATNDRKNNKTHASAIGFYHNDYTQYRKNIIIKDNIILTENGGGIQLDGVENVKVINNTISTRPNYEFDISTGGPSYSGIKLSSAGGATLGAINKDILIFGNTISNKTYGIYCQSKANTIIESNIIKSCRIGSYLLNYDESNYMKFINNSVSYCENGLEPQLNNNNSKYHYLISGNDFTNNNYGVYGFVSSYPTKGYFYYNNFKENQIASFHRINAENFVFFGNVLGDDIDVENGRTIKNFTSMSTVTNITSSSIDSIVEFISNGESFRLKWNGKTTSVISSSIDTIICQLPITLSRQLRKRIFITSNITSLLTIKTDGTVVIRPIEDIPLSTTTYIDETFM